MIFDFNTAENMNNATNAGKEVSRVSMSISTCERKLNQANLNGQPELIKIYTRDLEVLLTTLDETVDQYVLESANVRASARNVRTAQAVTVISVLAALAVSAVTVLHIL